MPYKDRMTSSDPTDHHALHYAEDTVIDIDFAEIDFAEPEEMYDNAPVIDIDNIRNQHDNELIDRLTADLQRVLSGENSGIDYERSIQQLVSMFHSTEKHILRSLSLYLCELNEVPRKIVSYLAHDSFTVAEPILEKSNCLDEEIMLHLTRVKGAEHWRSIATRFDLTNIVTESLAACHDFETSRTLLDNECIYLTDKAFDDFYKLSKTHFKLAENMSRREELPQDMALQIYWQVSKDGRSGLTQRHAIPTEQISDAFKTALADFHDAIRDAQNSAPTPLMWELAYKYKKQGKIAPITLVKTLHDGRTRFFIALLSAYSGIHYKTVFKAMQQPGGRMFTLICKALGFSKEHFVSSFLKSRSLVHSQTVVDASELHKAIELFDKIPGDKAKDIIIRS